MPEPIARDALGPDRRRRLIGLARDAIAEALHGGGPPEPPRDDPALLEHRAAFVTLRRRGSGALRGCRGEPVARRPLAASVVAGAIAAATDDPRFDPVSLGELAELAVEISALTAPRPILPEQIELGRHGLMIASGRRRGLLLPQVPAHHGLDVTGFLEALCRKAGLPRRAWIEDRGARLLGFEAEVWGEE